MFFNASSHNSSSSEHLGTLIASLSAVVHFSAQPEVEQVLVFYNKPPLGLPKDIR